MSQLQKIARGLTLFGSLLGVGYLFLGDGLSVLEVLTTLVVLVMAALSPASRVFDLVVLGLVALVYSAALSFPFNVESAGFTALLLTLGALQSGRPWATWGLIGGLSLGGLAIAVSFFRAGDHSTLGALGQLSFSLAWAGLVWLCREMRTDMPDLEPQRALSSEGQTDWIGKSLVCLAFCLPLGEGMGWFGMACLGFALAFHIKENGLDWRVFSIGRFGWPLGLWLVSGVLALWAGGFGWLDPGEVGRWGPLVALLGVLGAGRLAGAKWMGRIALAFCVSLILSAVVGIVQYAYGYELIAWIREWSGLDIAIKEQLFRPGFRDKLVAGGFYTHRLKHAHILLIGLGLLVVRQAYSKLENRSRLVELMVIGVCVVALALTLARGALVALVITLALLGFAMSRRVKLIGLAVTLLAVMALATQPEIRARAVSVTENSALGDRGIIWKTALGVLEDSPTGVGLGNYSTLLLDLYRDLPERARLPVEYAHSMALSTWVETGPIGLLGWCWFWWGLAAFYARALWSWRGEEVAMWGREAAALGLFVLIAYWVVGLTHDVLYHKPISLTFFALHGACWATVESARAQFRPSLNVTDRS